MGAPSLALREAARLLNVWASRGYVDTTPRALTYWGAQTAALTPAVPRTEEGLKTLLMLRLASLTQDGTLRAHSTVTGRDQPIGSADAFAPSLRRLVFERLLEEPRCGALIEIALGHVTTSGGTPYITWQQMRQSDQTNPAWLWLQEIDLAEYRGDVLHLDEALYAHAADVRVRRPLSQTELEERIALQRERGRLAELWVVSLERERLTVSGAMEYAEAITRVADDNALAGYDIESYELTGESRYIEVKCSSGPRDRFFLSANELDAATRLAERYWIAWVGWGSRLPDGSSEVAWFRDPAALLRNKQVPWDVSSDTLLVRRSGDDSAFAAAP